jgi:hypothetical protein
MLAAKGPDPISTGQKNSAPPRLQGSNCHSVNPRRCARAGAAGGMIGESGTETGTSSGGMVVDAYDGRGATLREFPQTTWLDKAFHHQWSGSGSNGAAVLLPQTVITFF